MKKLIPAVLVLLCLAAGAAILFQKNVAQRAYAKVANRLVELINHADYSGVEGLFNTDMSQSLPLEKATEFFKGLIAQLGKIQSLDAPELGSEGRVFPAHCERGVLDITLALDKQKKISGLLFKPHLDRRYAKVASRLVKLLNAADYSGVESLFNREMSQSLPLEKAAEFFKGLSSQTGKLQKLDDPEPGPEGMVFPAHFDRGVLDMTLTLDTQNKIAGLLFKPPAERNTKVANRLVALVNSADYFGVESLFNNQMSQALPLEKAAEFFKELSAQAGKIQKLDEPERDSEGMVFLAYCEHGVLDMTLTLDAQNKIAALFFKPHPNRYTKAANRLVELINAADYPGVENLFNKEMSQALPLNKAVDFFKGLTRRVGKIQKLDEPKSNAGWTVFPVLCERGNLAMSLALDDQGKIAGLLFKSGTPSPEAPPRAQLAELSLPFKGKWLVFWGGDTKELNHHHDVPAQKFAFDWVGVDETGETHRGDGSKNEHYFCFGREILAPADGVVVEAIDGVRDNTPGSMNAYCLVGNCVVIQHRTNEFSVLAHLQRQSVAVKPGQPVQRGQVLGKCGNSGNSSEPHLHFHLQDSAIFQDALGIKCAFDKVPLAGGATKLDYSPVKDDIINAE